MKNLNVTGFETWDENSRTDGGIRLFWEADCGFGTFDIYKRKDGTWACDDECMGRENVKQALELFLEKCVMESEEHSGLQLNGKPLRFDTEGNPITQD